MKKKKRQYFLVMGIFTLIIFSTLSVIFLNMKNMKLYEKSYEKYEVYNRFETEFAKEKLTSIFDYLEYKSNLDPVFFNENEISHLYDVKILMLKFKVILFFNLIIFISLLYFLYKSKEFYNLFPYILFFSGLIILLLFLFGFLCYNFSSFDVLFQKFHETFFKGNYTFDSKYSNMINLFPQGYFFEIAFYISKIEILMASLYLVLGYAFKKIKYLCL